MSLSKYIADNDADKERYEFKLEELHFDQKLDSFCVFSLKKSKIFVCMFILYLNANINPAHIQRMESFSICIKI